MINIAIIEDEKKVRELIVSYMKRYSNGDTGKFSADEFDKAEPFVYNYKAGYDIIFMDIELPGINGMEASQLIRKADSEVMIIFVTNMAQFAVKGYEVEAFDFIVKPVLYAEFAMKMDRATKALGLRKGRNIWVATRSGRKAVNTEKLMYVEIMRHSITFHSEAGDFSCSGTLAGVKEMLSGLPFVLCNRCYLVNMRFVTEVTATDVVINGTRLAVSKTRRKEFLKEFNNYIAGGGTLY